MHFGTASSEHRLDLEMPAGKQPGQAPAQEPVRPYCRTSLTIEGNPSHTRIWRRARVQLRHEWCVIIGCMSCIVLGTHGLFVTLCVVIGLCCVYVCIKFTVWSSPASTSC